ncbi:MAG: hypothetical protein V1754_03090 [Pseudomonadota bacterium]
MKLNHYLLVFVFAFFGCGKLSVVEKDSSVTIDEGTEDAVLFDGEALGDAIVDGPEADFFSRDSLANTDAEKQNCTDPTCMLFCSQGGCVQNCGDAEECQAACGMGKCEQYCQKTKSCTSYCNAGYCRVDCGQSPSCMIFCPGGYCEVDCRSSECTVQCPAGYCKIDCTSAGKCDVGNCGPGCDIKK